MFFSATVYVMHTFTGDNRFVYVKDSILEPPRDKINKMACAPSEDSDQTGRMPSDQRLHRPHEKSLGP